MKEEKEEKKLSESEEEELLKRVTERLKLCMESESENRKEAIEDLKFLNLDQWDIGEKARRSRKKRPVMVFDMLNKFIKQAVGDARQNKPYIKIRPLDAKASVHIANIREGIIKDIEYRSNADSIFDQAFESVVSCGYGAWRVLSRYRGDHSFDQELYLELLSNPFCAYLDPDTSDMVRADVEFGFIIDKITKKEFESRYPKASLPGDSKWNIRGQGQDFELWYTKNTITIVEYYEKEYLDKVVVQLNDGQVMDKEEAEEAIRHREEEIHQYKANKLVEESRSVLATSESTDEASPQFEPVPLEIVKERNSEEYEIKHYILTAAEILEGPTLWPGKYIPIILAYGEERNIEGKRYVRSLIRNAKDSQRLYNYWQTAAAELIALQPKAPFIGTATQFDGYEEDWKNANVENFAFLKYNSDIAAPGPPSRNQSQAQIPNAILSEISRAENNIHNTIGMFPADFGQNPGQERSGKAVLARQKPSDVVTFIYMDNLARAIAHTGRILNDLIPHIYDTDQDAAMRAPDGTQQFVPINTTVGGAVDRISHTPQRFEGMNMRKLKSDLGKYGPATPFNDISEGKYAVTVEVGPSFQTQRMENAENLLRMVQFMPEIRKLAVDLVAKNLDFQDAEELARRFRKTLPAGLIQQTPEEQQSPPMPPPPQITLLLKKVEAEQEKVKVKQAELALKIAQVQKEKSESVAQIRDEVIRILSELNAPPGQSQLDRVQQPPQFPQSPQPMGGIPR